MPEQAAIERARQDLEAARVELAGLLPDYQETLDRLASTQDRLGIHVETSTDIFANLAPLLAMLPDAIAADPLPGPVQPLLDDLLAWQLHLEPLLQHVQGEIRALWEIQAETVACQRRVQVALDQAGSPAEVRDQLAESMAITRELLDRVENMGNLVDELRCVGTEHALRVEEAHAYLLAELGGGHLVGLLEEIRGLGECLGNVSQEWSAWVLSLAAEYQRNRQRLQGLADVVVRVENAEAALVALIGPQARGIGDLSAKLPLVLFPVRLETRFDASILKVRIFPDTIVADTHDERLTRAELEAGRVYWEQLWEIPLPEHGAPHHRHEQVRLARAAREAEEAAWRGLLGHYSPARAAWIVQATQPGNLEARGVDPPQFPVVPLRDQQWGRGAQASILPDHWVVLAYRDGRQVHRVTGNPVQQPLALSPQPSVSPPDSTSAPAGSQGAGDPVAWMFDYQAALDVGMAVEVPLSQEDMDRGFDRLVVYGVKASLQAGDGQRRLEELLVGHHHTQGLAFVAQGTPTNNTSAATAGYPALDADGEESFAIERAERPLELDSDGLRLARALGVQQRILERVAGAERTSHRSAAAMNSALWTVTLGYYLNRMMSPVLQLYNERYGIPLTPEGAIEDVRRHFLEYVRGRGPLPAVRVCWTPYGVLPITSLKRWKPPAGTTDLVEGYLVAVLRTLQPVWHRQVGNVPRIGRDPGDPDRDLLEVLGMDASAREVRLRRALGGQFMGQLAKSAGLAWGELTTRTREITDRMVAVGDPALWDPEVLFLIFDENTYRFRNPLVAPEPLSEVEGLPPDRNYIAGVRRATMRELKSYAISGAKPPQPLLFFLLRHAALREWALEAWYRLGFDERVPAPTSPGAPVPTYEQIRDLQKDLLLWDREFHGILKYDENWKTVWDILDQALQFKPDLAIDDFNDALGVLESQPTAELEMLFAETLDVCSHRLDAWITSLATRRLEEMRMCNSQGCHLGAYGWVEHLHPDPASSYGLVTMPDGRTVRGQIDRGGYVHAPSMDHAATAAVLRSAFLTAGGAGQGRYAVNLSSGRVRGALELLNGLRQGQPLAALLGYRVERSLHERRLDKFVQPMRDLYPLVANKPLLGRTDDDGPASAVAARNVVDGLALCKAWRAGSLRLPGGLQLAQIEAELKALDEAADAVADLMLSEAVYQSVRGNMNAAAASLDSLARGVRTSDPEVVDQPRGGIPITHRVAVVLGGEPLEAGAWQAIPPTPRALAEPYVDAWAGVLLPNPERVLCRVYVIDPETGVVEPDSERILNLAELQLRPLDVLALAQGQHTQAAASELDQRIAGLFVSGEAEPVALAIEYARAEGWDRREVCTFPEILELAEALSAVLGSARPLRAADLAEPESVAASGAAGQSATMDAEEAARRAGEVMELLRLAIDELATAPHEEMRGKLQKASLFGLVSALAPVPFEELPARVEAAQAALAERLRQAEKAGSAPAEIVEAVFGQPVPFLPRFWPGDLDKLDKALRLGPNLVAEKPDAVEKWLQQAAHVRPGLGRWRRLAQYTQALAPLETGIRAMTFDVVQLPPGTCDFWAALPFEQDAAPPGGLVSLVIHRPGRMVSDAPWVGLLLDEWVEVIPNENEITGLAFHYDSPGTEAPQAVLIAVPPDDAPQWSEDALVDSLLETMDLAKLRLVDLDLLGEVGQLLPAILLAANTEGDAVGTDFTNLVIGEITMA